ncbi:MAG: class I SAM-dependent methyltransferase [Saprospiraceae bacterium]|nr:class I SAM-dependent methyltransferase [Saprospiraceae bacterium]
MYEFAEKVLDDDRWFYAFKEVEDLRRLLLSERTIIEIMDYGAGSQVSTSNSRTVKSLVKYSATSPIFCRILFRLVLFLRPKVLLELGTSMGISSLYQARAAQNSVLHSIEGCPRISKKAKQNIDLLKVSNIKLHTGKFEEQLPVVFEKVQSVDYVFIDGNHRKEPTLQYFETCLEKANSDSVFVFDDIHWTDGMENAWEMIKNHPKVTLSIDLFFFGIVFFKKEFKVKQHFTLVKSWWKPWQIGLRDFLGW